MFRRMQPLIATLDLGILPTAWSTTANQNRCTRHSVESRLQGILEPLSRDHLLAIDPRFKAACSQPLRQVRGPATVAVTMNKEDIEPGARSDLLVMCHG